MEVKLFRVSNRLIKNQCYLIYEGNSGILVDPAWDYELINNFLKDNLISLKGVLLTHSHRDHTDLAAVFAEEYAAPVYMSAIEISAYNFNCLHLIAVQHLEELIIGNFTVKALLTPGHTQGSTCYQIGDHCFTGDTIFIEGVGLSDDLLVNSLFDSVQFIKKYLPPQVLIWPGHSFGQTPGRELSFLFRNNLYFLLNTREAFVNFRMRKNQPDPLAFK
ncbi:glyoxylase-like metal-dependent hydrolase (beta-lactamase superfamily II) [Pedobacter cryoconitis]|uniref:Glyoxylase-like metal-dependent hydrolase (Beta-lactamase superfamily II) n=1 Tax=Pedobacter cryoconitis TaxID=188932 RepID=A0A7W8ZRP1_9SPHI|nr:MBL fold metallo-hydrolase [Pedobacter cryoconitis]MBB5638973.1 glyoxylase-like metal-dependent hydrolase (beta-lactamase superfamily II) [Pedobacter cryoconitis]